MVYLLLGEQSLIDKEIKDILQKETDYSLVKYDLLDDNIKIIIEDINTFNLFNNKKIIICNNFLKIQDEELLIKYLSNQNDNILIFTELNRVDERKKIIKEIRAKGKVINTNNDDLFSFIKSEFGDYSIGPLSINLLKDYCNNDYNRLKNEIEKLKIYKLDDKKVTNEDIKLLVKKGFDSNIFSLLDAIDKKNKKDIFKIYNELINSNEDELKLISVLASNYKLIYKVKELIKSNNDEECIEKLSSPSKKFHPYRFKILKEKSYNYSSKELLKNIKSLSDLDIKIKKGEINKKNGFELFLLEI